MACEGYACGFLAVALAVGGRCVEVIDSAFDGAVNQPVDGLLVYGAVFAAVGHAQSGETHTAVAEYAHLVASVGIGAVGHAAFNGCRFFLLLA